MQAVAEHVVALMLMLSKRIMETDRNLRRGTLGDRQRFMGHDVFGKTVGIIGLGNVGGTLAKLCNTLLQMEVLAYDPYLSAEVIRERGAEKVELDDLLRRSDFVSTNCPLSDETRNLIGAREYALMKPTAFYMNARAASSTTSAGWPRRCATRRSRAPVSTSGRRNRLAPSIR